MGNEDGVKCLTCRFSEMTPDAATNGEGICHLRPPTTALAMTPQGPRTMIVQTLIRLTTDWCAQHEVQLVKPIRGLEVLKK